MAIVLSPAHERVVDRAFELPRAEVESGDCTLEQRETICAGIEGGFREAERGELIDGEAAMEIVKQGRAERRKA